MEILFISGQEIFVVLLVILLLFGSKKIPELARGLGKGMNEFRKATDDIKREINNASRDIKEDVSELKKDVEKQVKDTTDSYTKEYDD